MGMSLQHMTALLSLNMVGAPHGVLSPPDAAAAAASAILPPVLTALTVLTAKLGNNSLNLLQLTALQRLVIPDSRQDAGWLSQLQLPSLTHLSLRYLHRDPLMNAADHWANLLKLQSLELSRVQMHNQALLNDLTSCLAAATSLTSLSINDLNTRNPVGVAQPIGVYAAVQGLPGLASLVLSGVRLQQGDIKLLQQLPNLTLQIGANVNDH